MSSRTRTSSARRRSAAGRLWGVDAARGLALLGMMTVHVIPTTGFSGEATWAGLLFSGRSAALFAVLAGVGLALLTGGSAGERSSDRLNWDRKVVAVRAVLIILIGLVLALLTSGVAIILVHYGVMFVLALPFLRLGARSLAAIAAAWVAIGPLLYWYWQNALRETLAPLDHPARLWSSPSPLDLTDPALLGMDLLVTGYYPLLIWPAYFFAGMAIGRLNLKSVTTAVWLTAAGAATAWVMLLIGRLTMWQSDIVVNMAAVSGYSQDQVRGALTAGDHVLPLVTDPWWFLLSTPHQGTPVELLHSIGVASAVLGLCLLLARPFRLLLSPLAGAGSMPLSIYAGHLVILHLWRPDGAVLNDLSAETLLLILVVAALALGLLKTALGRRGPLEAAIYAAGTAVAGPRP